MRRIKYLSLDLIFHMCGPIFLLELYQYFEVDMRNTLKNIIIIMLITMVYICLLNLL